MYEHGKYKGWSGTKLAREVLARELCSEELAQHASPGDMRGMLAAHDAADEGTSAYLAEAVERLQSAYDRQRANEQKLAERLADVRAVPSQKEAEESSQAEEMLKAREMLDELRAKNEAAQARAAAAKANPDYSRVSQEEIERGEKVIADMMARAQIPKHAAAKVKPLGNDYASNMARLAAMGAQFASEPPAEPPLVVYRVTRGGQYWLDGAMRRVSVGTLLHGKGVNLDLLQSAGIEIERVKADALKVVRRQDRLGVDVQLLGTEED